MRPDNRERLGPHDVVLAAHPGSGASWIGTLLVELGIFYASGHDELLADATSPRAVRAQPDGGGGLARPRLAPEQRARHLPALAARDALPNERREPLRVILTNDSALGWRCERPVVLLVRDGRDALLSLYHHLKSFSGLTASFDAFLDGNGGAWPRPAHSWAFLNSSWAATTPAERLHVLRFESARERPREEFRALLAFLGAPRDEAELARAIDASSYASMRRAESRALGTEDGEAARYMRRGQVGEWRERYGAAQLAYFSGAPRVALARFGYPTDGIP